jgi:epoxyqueuosine reductase
VLDARKCISYLTIELKGSVPAELREGIGDWLFGCDICQDVCPWNKKAPLKNDVAFRPRADLNPAELIPLLELDEIAFERTFGQTALSRPGRTGVLRNAAIVLGNQRDERSVPGLTRVLGDNEPILRGAAAWALGKIGGPRAQAALKSRLTVEDNATVLSEIEQALAQCPTKSSSE